MRDSLGGIPIIGIVTFFLVVTLGFLAFNVNYNKAFRMKNKAIDLFEEYYGADKCHSDSRCLREIYDYADSIGYHPTDLNCAEYNGTEQFDNLLCYRYVSATYFSYDEKVDNKIIIDANDLYYNDVYTKINIEIPIIKKMVTSVDVFYVNGSTHSFDPKKTRANNS